MAGLVKKKKTLLQRKKKKKKITMDELAETADGGRDTANIADVCGPLLERCRELHAWKRRRGVNI